MEAPSPARSRRTARWYAGVFVCAMLLLGSASPASERPDPWIVNQVKIALLTSRNLDPTDIYVDSIDGTLTLHGTVPNESQRAMATGEAERIEGVEKVRNLLRIDPEAFAARESEVDDDELLGLVHRELEAQNALSDSRIEVEMVDRGRVVLSGSARSLSDLEHALRTVRQTKGVRRVICDVRGPHQQQDAELWRRGAKRDPKLVSDGYTTMAVKLRLLGDERIPAADVNVDVREGTVVLFGSVPSAPARSAAEAVARDVRGVDEVRNDLLVSAVDDPEAFAERDRRLAKTVSRVLASRTQRAANVTVNVTDRVVELRGSVPSQRARLQVVQTARLVDGVRNVIDRLELRPSATRPADDE